MALSMFALASVVAAQDEAQRPPTKPAATSDQEAEPAMPAAREAALRRRAAAQGVIPDTIEFIEDIVYAEAPAENGESIPLTMDAAFLKRSDGKPMPAIVYIHGGGYVVGNKELGRRFVISTAQGGYFAASISYRLADEAKYPAAVHDCKAAIRFLRANAEPLGIDPARIGVWGHSAGGHLSALLATTGNSDAFDVEDAPSDVGAEVACVVTVSGPSEFLALAQARGERAAGPDPAATFERWFGAPIREVQDKARQASPTTYIDESDPAFLVVHGMSDDLVPLEQAVLLVDALKAKGVDVQYLPVDGAGHRIDDPQVYLSIARFFDQQLGGQSASVLNQNEGKEDAPQAPMLQRRDPANQQRDGR